jgi:hypothetical protein
MPVAISAAAAIAECRAGLGFGGRPEPASTTGDAGDRSSRPPGSGGCPEDGEEDGHCDQAPWEAEPVDAVVDRGLECGREDDPQRESRDRPGDRCDRPGDGPVGHQHEAEVLLCGADCREHAELAEPSLCDDREPRGGNQRGQDEEDRGNGEHRHCLGRAADVVSIEHGTLEGRARAILLGLLEGVARIGARVDEHGDPVRARRRGCHESELVAQLHRAWGAETRLGGQLVLVDEAAE